MNPALYRTELCHLFAEKGHCQYGDGCAFAHGKEELRYRPRHPKHKTQLCRLYHSQGKSTCPYGQRCRFIHDLEEARGQLGEHMAQWTSRTRSAAFGISRLSLDEGSVSTDSRSPSPPRLSVFARLAEA